MSKIWVYFVSLWLVCTASCTRQDLASVASRSDPFRGLLLKYYSAKGHFPSDPSFLSELNASFRLNGGLWNGWNYTAYDPDQYNLWIYPGRTRQSLWFKFNAKSRAETGWYICRDDGRFIPQEISLVPEEQEWFKHER
jgi:hypothetical protein